MSRSTGAPSRAASRARLGLLAVAMLAAFGWLLLRLHDVQVRDAERYVRDQDQTSLRRVRLPATRGRILDRNGAVLAGSRPRYCVAVYLDELRAPGDWSNTVDRVCARLDEVEAILGPDAVRAAGRREVWKHLRLRRPIPLIAFRDLTEAGLARLLERPRPLGGVDVYVQQDRVYPFGDLACHVIGYVGKGEPAAPPPPASDDAAGPDENGAESFDFLMPDLVGRSGIEKSFDAVLAGRGGARRVRIDAIGYRREIVSAGEPVPGADVALTLDVGVQRLAERALGDKRGAAVVLDARNGDVLALASAPRYDLSRFVPALSDSVWSEILNDPDRPLVHRAASGVYPPGSIVKPVVALAALGSGALREDEILHCSGAFRRNGINIDCASRYGHGDLDVRRALAVSCNPFFIEAGMRLGWNPALRDAFETIGFGRVPRLGIPAASGLLPDAEWKRRARPEGDPAWHAGDTALASIGQGFVSATPLQAALLALALANDGAVLEPRLVRDPGDGRVRDERTVLDQIVWNDADLAAVRDGMVAAALPGGTAHRAAVPGVELAAKTGTAEYDDRRDGRRHKHAWIIGYAPARAPRYAFAVLAEDADSGGRTAASVLHEILAGLFFPGGEGAPADPEEPA